MSNATEATLQELLELARTQNMNVERLVALFERSTRPGAGGGSGVPGAAAGVAAASMRSATGVLGVAATALGAIFGTLTSIIGGVVSGFTSLASGTLNLVKTIASGTATLSSIFAALEGIPVLGRVASVFSGLMAYGEDLLKVYIEMSKSGASFSGNLLTMVTAAARSNLTLEEFSKVVLKNSQLIAVSGGDMQAGVMKFASAQNKLMGVDSPYARNVTALGVSSAEAAEYLTTVMQNMGSSDRLNRVSSEELAKRTGSYIEQLDMLTKLTGKQRETYDAEVRKMQADEVYLQLLERLPSEVRTSFTTGLAGAVDMAGVGIANMMKESLTGTITVMTAESQQMVTQLGGLAVQAANDLAKISSRTDLSNEQRQREQMRIYARLAKDYRDYLKQVDPTGILAQNDPAFRATLNQPLMRLGRQLEAAGDDVEKLLDNLQKVTDAQKNSGAAALQSSQENIKRFQNVIAELRAKLTLPITDVLAKWTERITTFITNITESKTFKAVFDGLSDFVKKYSDLFNNMLDSLSKSTSLEDFWKRLKESVGSLATTLWTDLRPVLSDIWQGLKKFIPEIWSGAQKVMNDVWGVIGPDVKEFINNVFIPKLKNILIDIVKSIQDAFTPEWVKKLRNLFSSSPQPKTMTPAEMAANPNFIIIPNWQNSELETGTMPTPTRATGSIGSTGKIFENWGSGTKVELHGTEGVITPDQMSEIVASALNNQQNNNLLNELRQLNSINAEILKFARSTSEYTRRNIDAVRDLNGNLY